MISAWWLLLIVPVALGSAYLGMIAIVNLVLNGKR